MNIKIYNLFILVVLIIIFIFGSTVFYIYQIDRNAKSLKSHQYNTSVMFEKIYELRQSIDDLTRFARTYTITQDITYLENYNHILKIRSGNISKPKNYFFIYWDLLTPLREARHPDTNSSYLSLKQEMNGLPYSDYEDQMLEESRVFTKELLKLEKKAFEAIDKNNTKLAIDLLYSKDYHQLKEKVMLPLDRFIIALERRTTKMIEEFNSTNEELYKGLYTLILLGIVLTLIATLFTYKKILAPIKKLTSIINAYKKGDKNLKEFNYYEDEMGYLIRNFFEMKHKIDEDFQLLKHNASHDPLINILNRKAFFEVSNEIFKLSKRDSNPLSILMLDIDFFKKVNDNYGHQIGDEILKFVSSSISALLRKSDLFGRYGGEEFIVLLPNTLVSDAKKIALKINQYIYTNPYVDKENKIDISISIGVAEKQKEHKLSEIINKADNALYKAKNSGRNCVKVF